MKSPSRPSSLPIFLARLIRTAYLPSEVPPVITAKYFSKFCENKFDYLKGKQKNLTKHSTNYETFTAPRTVSGRRNLAIVHPRAQLHLSLLITHNRAKIKKIIDEGGKSLYRTSEYPKKHKAFEGLDFRKRDTLAAGLYSERPYVLHADISRFFYTVYTHSIPWAVLGKETAKDWLSHDPKKLKNHWSNGLDSAIQLCQSRETFGIPVGPDTSRIIAEVLLAGVEADDDFSKIISGYPAFRLLDDYVIGFDDENTAKAALGALRTVMWKFNLQLNEEKTFISESRFLYREGWKLDFESIVISDEHQGEQAKDIYRLVDHTLHFCQEAGTGAPASWACRRLWKLAIFPENFELVLDALFRLARDHPSCMHHVASFVINHHSMFDDPKMRKKVETWVKATISTNIKHVHDSEITWCLLVGAVLQISFGEAELPPFEKKPNAVVFTMLGVLRERGLLSVSLSKWGWKSGFKQSAIYGEYWLPYYEAVRRKWTKDKKIISAITADPIFSKMLATKVTFIDDRILDAVEIPLPQEVLIRLLFKPVVQIQGVEAEPDQFVKADRIIPFELGGYDGFDDAPDLQ